MKDIITESQFIQRFDEMNRGNNFTVPGRRALFNWIVELEDDTGNEIELDVIAFCCEYDEYEDIKEYLENYETDIDKADYEEDQDYDEAVKEEIQDKTTLIDIDGTSFIIAAY